MYIPGKVLLVHCGGDPLCDQTCKTLLSWTTQDVPLKPQVGVA